jgi:pimeloyl-ACP methyl ester carboxylesterase
MPGLRSLILRISLPLLALVGMLGVSQASAVAATPAAQDMSIRPFAFKASDEALADLRRRVETTRWPGKETVPDASQGVQLATMQKLARYWTTEYDWRRFEKQLNALPNFVTTIDGLDIHFIHVKSKHPKALPIILTHGWPGSFVEMLKIIDPLTNPTAHGGSAEDAFDVVVPSMPGYGFSGKPGATGWDPVRIARAWGTLMKRLGYTRYVAQGGDWGDPITETMAIQAPSEVIAIHSNMPAAVPPDILKAVASGAPAPAGLSPEEKRAYEQLLVFFGKGLAYAQEMGNRPQTLYAIEDSPIGLAAWILDHDIRSYELIARVFDGQKEGLSRDDILDNVTVYWLTGTAVSSARLYWENKLPFFLPMGVTGPVAVTAFPDELYQAPRSWAEKAFPNLIHYNRAEKGGHFAAWEQPAIFVGELRAAFKSVR